MKASRAEQTAYHEAGHAVVGYLLGLDPGEVSINPDRKTGARGRVSGLGTPLLPMSGAASTTTRELRAKTENEVVVLLAGVLAEAKRTGQYNWLGAAGDLVRADELLVTICPTRQGLLSRRRRLERRAQKMIDQRASWVAVETMAAALVDRRRLSGAEVMGLIRSGLVEAAPQDSTTASG